MFTRLPFGRLDSVVARRRGKMKQSAVGGGPDSTSMVPAPVRVVFPNGYSEIGKQIAPTVIELSWAAVGLQLREPLQVDRRTVTIVAKTVLFKRDAPAEDSDGGSVRVTFEEPKA